MAYETLLVDFDDKVAKVTLNRPEKRNAMNPQLVRDMVAVLEEIRYRDDITVLVVTGAGNAFCAGMDLKEFFYQLKNKDPHEYDRVTRGVIEFRGRTLPHFPKVTIAMVNGYCFGGGFPIVEGCDLAIAADEAVFGLSEINFKMFPGGLASRSIGNIFRPRDGLFYALTGDNFNGKQAAAMGFVNHSVPAAQLEAETMALARRISVKDPAALKAAKDAFRFSQEMSFDAAMNYSGAKEQEVFLAQKGAWVDAGIGDFLQHKYKPGLGGHEKVEG